MFSRFTINHMIRVHICLNEATPLSDLPVTDYGGVLDTDFTLNEIDEIASITEIPIIIDGDFLYH